MGFTLTEQAEQILGKHRRVFMSYVRSRRAQGLDSRIVQGFAKLVGLNLPQEDLDSLSISISEQMESLSSLDRMDLANNLPILKMDPRWHE
jgi:hypothetical protein